MQVGWFSRSAPYIKSLAVLHHGIIFTLLTFPATSLSYTDYSSMLERNNMSEASQSYDVVICGAGPVGLLIAYYLSRAGLSVFVAGNKPASLQLKAI